MPKTYQRLSRPETVRLTAHVTCRRGTSLAQTCVRRLELEKWSEIVPVLLFGVSPNLRYD